MKTPNILKQAAQAQQQNATAKRANKIDNAIRSLDKNQRAADGAISKRLSETGSRLVEVAAKTTKRFGAMRDELDLLRETQAARAELANLTERAWASLRRIRQNRDRNWDALYTDYLDNHYKPLKAAYEAALVRHREEASAVISTLQDLMTKKSLTLRKLAPGSEAHKRALATYKVWRDAEFQPKVNAAHDAREKAAAEAQTVFYGANRAAHAAYMARFNAERARWEPAMVEAKALIADLDVQAKALSEAGVEKPYAGIDVTITDSNGTRYE